MQYREFFQKATEQAPYPYQERFAEVDPLAHFVRAPTGAGKTATAILGWLWRHKQIRATPRRLVYCLPMRVLVEQTHRETESWLKKLKHGGLIEHTDLHVLMGGVEAEEWFFHPERPTILIGTQDMLLSRALNRAYAASRFHWPIDFGLLNNDCLWVFDEPQLMGSGVSTSAQLAGLRQTLGTFGNCPSVWMSATLEPDWLNTIDFAGKFPGDPLELDDRDYDPRRPLFKRMTAEKTLEPLGVTSSKDMKDVAKAVLEKHVANTQTLVVLNTVERAKAVLDALTKLRRRGDGPRLLLVHSRFRPAEREQLNEQLQAKGEATRDRIIVATQVVEAGVDISSRTLITELAPWGSIVQRMGRCNRTGDDGPGQVFWIKLDTEKQALPYEARDLEFAREQLEKLDGRDVSPKALDDFKREESIKLPFTHKHVLRRRDLLELFDTTPDLHGNDIDIQRFVRGDDPEIDVQVFWRVVPKGGPDADEPLPDRRELCSVPVGQVREFLERLAGKKRGAAYVWDHLDDDWAKLDPRQVRPGLTILLPASVGGYDWDDAAKIGKGWEPGGEVDVTPLPLSRKVMPEGAGSDPLSEQRRPLTITVHTQNVCNELEELLAEIVKLPDGWASHLQRAARWHDVGKAHEAFQIGMRKANPTLDSNQLWAKSGTNAPLRHGRKHFRHELASALVSLQQGLPFQVAYLIATHHGRVRLSIRALPGEEPPDDPNIKFALGVRDDDTLPEVDLGDNELCPATKLDLTPMLLGGESSWTARAIRLLTELGPFRLAYLEALLRAADVRASQKEAMS
jgi:CRISPR-associated endonuclease/helicase Cas3